VDLFDGLLGHRVGLGGPTELGEPGQDGARLVFLHEHAHGGLATCQLGRDPLAILGVESQALVVLMLSPWSVRCLVDVVCEAFLFGSLLSRSEGSGDRHGRDGEPDR